MNVTFSKAINDCFEKYAYKLKDCLYLLQRILFVVGVGKPKSVMKPKCTSMENLSVNNRVSI